MNDPERKVQATGVRMGVVCKEKDGASGLLSHGYVWLLQGVVTVFCDHSGQYRVPSVTGSLYIIFSRVKIEIPGVMTPHL